MGNILMNRFARRSVTDRSTSHVSYGEGVDELPLPGTGPIWPSDSTLPGEAEKMRLFLDMPTDPQGSPHGCT